MLDYGVEYILWPNDDISRLEFDSVIDSKSIGLSLSTQELALEVVDIFDTYLNPVYQGYPSF